jgi:hypothetical protein
MERQTTPPNDPTGEDPFADWERERSMPPPNWERGSSPPPPGLDPRALFVLLDGLRHLVPRELEGQLTNLIREFLLTLRALIDWYLERLDRPEKEPHVEDIPID